MANELKGLFAELKAYLQCEKRFLALSVAEKATVILSMLIIVGVLLLMAGIIAAFLLQGLAYHIGALLGNTALGFVSVAGIALLLTLLFYVLRTNLVINPLARFMHNLFASTIDKEGQP